MAFALTKFEAFGTEVDEALTKQFVQEAVFTMTGQNTDVDLDIGDYSGTFWTAVGGTAPGITALKAIKDIQTRARTFVHVGGNAIAGKAQDDASYTTYTGLTSAALAGGGASETATVTGLATTDTILATSMSTKNGTATVALTGWSDQATNSLKCYFTADPGAGGKVLVLVSRTATAVLAGTYQLAMDGTNTNLPNILFASGDAPTSYVLVLRWLLKAQEQPVKVTATA